MKKLVALLLAAVMIFALCACGSTGAAANSKKTIYVLAPNPDHGWTGAIGVFAKEKVDALNAEGKYNVVLQTFATADDQIKQIEDIVSELNAKSRFKTLILTGGVVANICVFFCKFVDYFDQIVFFNILEVSGGF